MSTKTKMIVRATAMVAVTKALLLATSVTCLTLALPCIATAQEVLPFPPTPSAASPAGRCRTRCTSTRVEPRRLPKDAPNILIVLIDDVGAGPGQHLRRRDQHADDGSHRQGRHRLQPLSHDGHVLAHPRGAAVRAEPSPRRQRPDCRAGQRLGRLLRHHPQEQRHGGRGAEGLRLRHRRRSANGTTRPPSRRPPPGRSITGRPATASSTSTGSSPARPRSTSRAWCGTRPTSSTPSTSGGHDYYHLSEDLADDAINYLRRHKAFQPDKPFFMYWASGAVARPAPRHEGVGRQVQGQVRRRLGQVPRARLPESQGQGLDSRERGEHAAARRPGVLGQHSRGREALPAPPDGGLCRVHRARGLTRSAGSWTKSRDLATATTR